mgnify:CR=1 FL=1
MNIVALIMLIMIGWSLFGIRAYLIAVEHRDYDAILNKSKFQKPNISNYLILGLVGFLYESYRSTLLNK